jgi:hypothetical protein
MMVGLAMTEPGFGLCGERLVLLDALSDVSVKYSSIANELVDLAGTSRRPEFEHTTRRIDVARSEYEAASTSLRDHEVAHGCGTDPERGGAFCSDARLIFVVCSPILEPYRSVDAWS